MNERIDVVLGDARSLPVGKGVAGVVFIEDTLELFSEPGMRALLAEARRILGPNGRLGVVTMEKAGAEVDVFVRTYGWLFDHLPGFSRFGCRPVYARRALEDSGFQVERKEYECRAGVWPVEILFACPG